MLNLLVGLLFKLRMGCGMMMKDRSTGKIPLISYVLWMPFHLPTWLYTYVHTKVSKNDQERSNESIIQSMSPSTPEHNKSLLDASQPVDHTVA